ncbi:MAG TPA: uroporphyrinogen decarboxylase [Myxococcales bacterium]|jgi:uroporphyrinogen decarboxylase|nr:uroporphyrinogen decarboxylase [Myxococcales bacterium]
MSRADRFLRACRQQPVDRTPVWIMRQAGRYLPEYRAVRAKVGFLELCKTPELATEVTLQPVRILGVDAAILFSDILLVCEAMGAPLVLDDQGPQFPEPLRTRADVERLHVPDPEAELPFVMEAIRRTRKELAGEVPLIGFSGAPWTLAAYMIEGKTSRSFEKAKAALLADDALAELLLGKIADAVALYLNAQLAAGAQAVQIFDSWAGALSADDYARLGAPYLKRIVSSLVRDPVSPQPVIVFGVETGELLPLLAHTGADVVGVDWRVSLTEARKRVGPNVALQGNLDPTSLFLPREKLEARVRSVLDDARAAGGGHVFNLGHGILPGTPVDGARALVELVHASLADRPGAR